MPMEKPFLRVSFVLLQFLMLVAQAKLSEQLECLGIIGLAFLLLLEIYYLVNISDSKLRQISYIDCKFFNSKSLHSHY